ncbi:hypothetical protein PEX2_060660 [Penicillium expansum]|uniref:Uncharacterized protein n=1 Tax=Penicillium expansum TaxID=27334 RepID=A0A0A2JDL3_PENEN|nr:hypothetical protein PEX2_060660 [Penicillium expansum]KGO53459.1 hypothetical protein PEX2_060660 [Penicillium expansum]
MKYYHGRSILDSLNGFALFGNECSLGLRLLDLGYSFTAHAPFSLADRQSILYLLSRTDESIQIPDIVRIIFRGSEHQLRDALKSGKASPSDIINGDSLIEYAFGWPKGIQILLEAGAARSPTCSDVSCIRYVEENDEEDTYHSVKLLIEAGCLFDWYDISRCEQNGRSSKIKLLLINELAARRKRLWHLAQSCLPAGQLPKLISDDENTGTTTIFDIHTAEIHDRLVKQGVSIDPSLRLNFSEIWYKSVYHFPEFTAQTLEELYQIGFRGITQVTPEGFMPLVIPRPRYYSTGSEHNEKWKGMERIAWLVSKGADPYQELPGTSATVTHHLGLTIVDYCLDALPGRREVKLENQKHYRAWKRMVSEFGKEFFLLPLVRDRCVCACSPDGCTTMSVTLRHIIDYIPAYRIHEPEFWYRELIQFLLCWTRGDTGIGWKVIRFLTFDALGLKHSCCINTPTYPFDFSFRLKSREEEEVEEILDEQKLGLIELEKILDELKIKFDELGQPVIEFLEGYWHTRMIEFLSQRDPYDEDHVIESRRMGVALEPDECVVPDRVSLLIGSKIMYEIST